MSDESRRKFVATLSATISSIFAFLTAWSAYDIGKNEAAIFALIAAFVAAYMAYKVHKEPQVLADSMNEYAQTIARVEEIKSSISHLSEFLERERQRVASVEATVSELNKKKEELEPIVATKKETVDAILSAYAKQTARSLWNDRIISFVVGVTASIVASIIFDALKVKGL